ncbi:hypothetical protein RclHR1_00010029 [Rhizophagus clarus]|nr:hypothetical protein RclHR1_00010029 [Rhizophagus clarus]
MLNDAASNTSVVTGSWFPGIILARVIKKCNAFKLYRKPDKELSLMEKTELCFGNSNAREVIFNNDPRWTYEEDTPFHDMLTKVCDERPFILVRRAEDIHLSWEELVTFGLTENEWKELVEEEKITQKIRKGSSLEETEHDQRNKKLKIKEKSQVEGEEL